MPTEGKKERERVCHDARHHHHHKQDDDNNFELKHLRENKKEEEGMKSLEAQRLAAKAYK